MRVKLLTICAGPTYSGAPGDILDIPEAAARGLLAGGYATEPPPLPDPLEAPLSPSELKNLRKKLVDEETASMDEPAEKAVAKRGKRG